ncbi:MAG: hypothetical protein JWO06_2228, partial [Bacteroidota bacterium]|nr:hypothetical protein [Bacteroidota bacterium]
NNRSIPQFVVDGGDVWTNPYLVVNKQALGVGIDPGTYSTLALKGATGTSVNIYEGASSGWDGTIRFVSPTGDIRSVITDDLTTNDLTINPGYGGSASGILRIEGGVQIGDVATPTGYSLWVSDGILSERVKVALKTDGTNWSDYVFDKQYKLMSIEDLERYVKKNKHLPNVPSAKEVATEGIDLGSMDARLLEKIEELSLYVIAQQKEIEKLKKHISK